MSQVGSIISEAGASVISHIICHVLPNIISIEQKGFATGRNIVQENRLLQDIIDYTEMEDEEVAIIFLDQQKAFDRSE
jgi:hypothetical protein